MERRIDLNADLGESFGRWTLGDDEGLIRHITSANVACGFHAGDVNVIDATVELCRASGVAVGAQPGYPDLAGFGRRPLPLEPAEVERVALYQLGALEAFCRAHGVSMRHVKPHGALYNSAAADEGLADAVARAIARFSPDLALFGLASSEPMRSAASRHGLRFVPEAFADRRYRADGSLQPRTEHDALILDPATAASQAVEIATTGSVSAVDGGRVTLPVAPESICCHGDTPGAVEIAAAVRAALESAGVDVAVP